MEMLMACKEFGIEIISKIANKIYNNGNILEEMRSPYSQLYQKSQGQQNAANTEQ